MSTTAAGPGVAKRTSRFRFNELRSFFSRLHVTIRAILLAVLVFLMASLIFATILLTITLHYIYFDRTNLPDVEAFIRFDCLSLVKTGDCRKHLWNHNNL